MPVLPKSRVSVLSASWQAHIEDHVISLAWSPDSRQLAVASVAGPIRVFDATTGALINPLAGHAFGTTAVCWSPNGGHFASAGQDGRVRLWDLATGHEDWSLEAGAEWVESISWCRGNGAGPLLATAAGRKLRVWTATGSLLSECPDHPSTISDIKWMPSNKGAAKMLLASAAYGQLAFWDAKSREVVKKFEWKGSMLTIAWSPNGRFVATGNQDSTVHFWNVKTGDDLQMSGYPTKVRELSWDFNSRYLATGGGDRITIWDCADKGPAGSKPIVLKGHQGKVNGLAYQPSGVLLASGGTDGLIALWNPAKRNKPLAVHVLDESVTQVCWSPDSRCIAAASHAGQVKIISMAQKAG